MSSASTNATPTIEWTTSGLRPSVSAHVKCWPRKRHHSNTRSFQSPGFARLQHSHTDYAGVRRLLSSPNPTDADPRLDLLPMKPIRSICSYAFYRWVT